MSAAVLPRAAAHPNTLVELRVLLRGAEILGGGEGNALQLCLLSGVRIGEAVAARLEDVDWRGGILHMPAERRTRLVPLSHAAQATILHACGGVGGRGQLVTGGRGTQIGAAAVRIGTLRRLLASTDPATTRVEWTWPSLRRGIATALMIDGVDSDSIGAFLGVAGARPRWHAPPGWRHAQATPVAHRWARLLLPPTGSAP